MRKFFKFKSKRIFHDDLNFHVHCGNPKCDRKVKPRQAIEDKWVWLEIKNPDPSKSNKNLLLCAFCHEIFLQGVKNVDQF